MSSRPTEDFWWGLVAIPNPPRQSHGDGLRWWQTIGRAWPRVDAGARTTDLLRNDAGVLAPSSGTPTGACYASHYNSQRLRRGIQLRVPEKLSHADPVSIVPEIRSNGTILLSGLIHEYHATAA